MFLHPHAVKILIPWHVETRKHLKLCIKIQHNVYGACDTAKSVL